MISAKLCAVFAIAWCAIVCFWYGIVITVASIGLVWLLGYVLEYILAKKIFLAVSKNTTSQFDKMEERREFIRKQTAVLLKQDSDYWWEMCAFGATFTTVIVQSILNML